MVSAFVFMDAAGNEDKDIPGELKMKYTLSRILGRYVLKNLIKYR